jgi:NNP family nitrate/nitrite transporter-like MFS transporter
LKDKDSWLFMGFYCVTFGGFVGLAGALPGYFHDQYGLDPKMAGYYTAACVFGGSLMRPVGGFIADRFGGIRSLTLIYTLVAILIFLVGTAPSQAFVALSLFVAAMLVLGAGNGSVFQLVPQRFSKEIGVMTGLIGMAGGIGGFLLAAGLGYSKSLTGSYQIGLWVFAALALCSWIGLLSVKMRWRTTWGSLTAARI